MTTRSEDDLTLPVAVAAAVPLLIFRLGVVFVRVKARRRKGVRAFRKALLLGGMNREQANELSAQYASYGRLRTYLREGLGALPFSF